MPSLVWSEKQVVSSWILSLVTDYISSYNNRYTKHSKTKCSYIYETPSEDRTHY